MNTTTIRTTARSLGIKINAQPGMLRLIALLGLVVFSLFCPGATWACELSGG